MKASTFHDRVSQYPHHHRIALAVLLTVMFCMGSALGQNTAFTLVSPYTGLSTDQAKVVNFATNQPHLGSLQYIDWAPGGLIDNNGYITVALPGENGGQPISFELLDSYFANETSYAVFGSSHQGEIAIYITPEGTGGSITLANSAYVLYPLGGTKGVFIKKDPSETGGGTCATDTTPGEGAGYCEDDCGKDIIDVLTMVTPAAWQWLGDNYGMFGLWFLFMETNNINGALINSDVPNKRVRVQTISYTPDFPLSSNITTDRNNLTASLNAQQTLQQSGADVGILLTNQPYGSTFGITNSLDPASTNKFCVAQVAFIDPIRYTYAHELAHQIGCLHSSPSGADCPHGKNMAIGKNIIMANNAANNTRIQHFSNPDVFFGGESTGTATTRDNAAQLRGAFCEVANNNSPIWFATDYTHSSASSITPDCPFTASANVQPGMQEIWGNLWNCGTSYTYQWAWSTNNVNYTNFGTNSPTLSLSAAPSCPVFYLRLTVTTPVGCSATFTKMFVCNPHVACRSSSPQDKDVAPVLDYDRVYPNPANDRITVKLEGVSTVRQVAAFNTNGVKAHTLPIIGQDGGILVCDVSNLPTGLWFIEINSPEKRKVLKLAIVR